jgi:pimeloyl-ACP methyl ester carboxylesterase
MAEAPIVLVPGFWLGAWAWDDVIDLLRADGHEVSALTLPGLDSREADRSTISATDHVHAIVEAVRAENAPVVLAVHSAAGFAGYAATDQVPELIAHMIYVDSGPGIGAPDPGFDGVELPLPPQEKLAEEESLDGLTDEHLERLRERAVPVPGGVLREAIDLTNPSRLWVPTTQICTAFTSEQYKEAVEESYPFVAGLKELRNVTWIDLPTSHWPMWSRSKDLAEIIADIARGARRS